MLEVPTWTCYVRKRCKSPQVTFSHPNFVKLHNGHTIWRWWRFCVVNFRKAHRTLRAHVSNRYGLDQPGTMFWLANPQRHATITCNIIRSHGPLWRLSLAVIFVIAIALLTFLCKCTAPQKKDRLSMQPKDKLLLHVLPFLSATGTQLQNFILETWVVPKARCA